MINFNITPTGGITANYFVEGVYVTGGGGGSGTVTNVGTGGSGLGFSLSGGPITTTGTVTLNTPTVSALRTTLNIGNVANLNLDGNVSNVLAGDGTFIAAGGGGGSGTVTSVATSGSGLGFSLTGGPITTTGTVTLNIPSDTSLRTSLNIGNVANINLNGDGAQFLAGNGSWLTPAGGGSGTVTEVSGNGSGLGFSLGGTVTTTGNITLTAPTAGDLRTSLNIGNVANLNLDGNVSNVLAGDGTWVKNVTDPAGSNTEIQFNNDGAFGSSNNFYWSNGATIKANGIGLNVLRFSDSGFASSALGRARGNTDTPVASQANDRFGHAYYFYTGNGNVTLGGLSGYALGGAVYNRLDTVPTGSNVPSTSMQFLVSNTVTNTTVSALTLESDLTANVFGNLNLNSGLKNVKYATENVGIIGAQTGTYNFDFLSNSVQYSTATATANITLNFRGNSTVTANSVISTNQSIVGTYIMTTGATAYTISAVQIDGSAQTIKWVGGTAPTANTNSVNAYTFTLIKIASTPTFTVLGSMTRYA